MLLILLKVNYIIQNIDRTGDEAEEEKGKKGLKKKCGLKKTLGKDKSGKDCHVLCPLLGSEASKE
jgi:hypothetical protein